MKTFVTRRVVIRLLWVLGFGAAGFVVYAWLSEIAPLVTRHQPGRRSRADGRWRRLSARSIRLTSHRISPPESGAGHAPPSSARCAKAWIAKVRTSTLRSHMTITHFSL